RATAFASRGGRSPAPFDRLRCAGMSLRLILAGVCLPLIAAFGACGTSPSSRAGNGASSSAGRGAPGPAGRRPPDRAGGRTSIPVDRSSSPRVPASQVPPAAIAAAVAANNAFAVDLYAHVRAVTGTGNLLTAPLSASLALTMTYAGAKGSTAAGMATALH